VAAIAKTPPKVRHLAMAFGVVVLWVPLEWFLAYFAWSIHYENVAQAHGILTESDYRPEIERAAGYTVWPLVAVEALVVAAVWWSMRPRRHRSTSN
jgi:hypothetical protein